MKKVLPVTSVAFSGRTGDNRSPESFPLPACMTSLMETLGDDYGAITIHAHNRGWLHRRGNDLFLGATGMAFGLLWRDDFCTSSLDLMQVNRHDETIRRAFAWAGYEYRILERSEDCDPWSQIVDAIDRGVPVLAFGLFGPPECAIIAGYDVEGHTLIGWSHFQDELSREENGMFRCTGWESEWWKLVFPGAKATPTLDWAAALSHALSVLNAVEDGDQSCMRAGQAAYNAWTASLLALDGRDTSACRTWYDYHHATLFTLAELRAWGAYFLEEGGAADAAGCFRRIHDLCWAADAVTGSDGAAALANTARREALADVLHRIQAQDAAAAASLKEFLQAAGGQRAINPSTISDSTGGFHVPTT